MRPRLAAAAVCPTWTSDPDPVPCRGRPCGGALVASGVAWLTGDMNTSGPPLHEWCEPFAPLLGTWRGAGTGDYPTIEPFAYLEEVTFGHVGKPFLSYLQRTRDADTGEPLHTESGYLRTLPGGQAELVVAQPTGIVELHAGRIEAGTLDLASTTVATTATAKDCEAVTRVITVVGDELRYELAMAAVGLPMQHHLSAILRRDP